ncbi:MAG: hypothetical protein U9Q18_05935 [Caldisericota bacterium]|nr:hypothetical protein [Caldisericota bacterium]
MILHKRKGMALITVVLIAALFLISIVGISAKVITDKKVSNARASSERALVAAESCISQVLFDLRNTYFWLPPDYQDGIMMPRDADHYLSLENVKNIASNDPVYTLYLSEHRYSESDNDVPYITYKVTIKKISDGIVHHDPLREEHAALLEIYSLGTVYSSKDGDVLARRVIGTECEVVFNSSSDATINYGLLAGGDIEFRGNSQEIGGDIFANGKIISKGQGPGGLRVDGGAAYASSDDIPAGIASGGEVTGMAAAEIPSFDEYNADMAYEFKTGDEPYDGSEEGYPDTSAGDGLVAAVIQSCLGSDDTGNTLDEIQKFYSDLMGCTVDDGNVVSPEESCADFNILNAIQLFDLQDNAKNIVYYINGDVTITAGDLFKLKGIVVVGGNVTINSNAKIGDYSLDENGDPVCPDEPQFALIVKGTAKKKKQAGTAEFYGLLYAVGGIEGTGTFDCYGAMVTPGNIKMLGDVKTYYKPTGFNTADVSGHVSSGISNAELGLSSWKEISYEDFQSP